MTLPEPELSLLHQIHPYVLRASSGGFVILLDKSLTGHVYSHIVSAEGCLKIAMKTLEVLRNQATDNKDLISAAILGAGIKALQVEIGKTMLRMGAEAVEKQ